MDISWFCMAVGLLLMGIPLYIFWRFGVKLVNSTNRNLKTFQTNLQTTQNLMPFIPKGQVVISESGIHTREDMELLESLGVDGVLIGESLIDRKSVV